MSTVGLEKLFNPQSIAVIGASNKKGSVGYILLRNIIQAEYRGVVHPVNNKAASIQGIQAYPTIGQVPGKVDLAVISVPAAVVPETMRQCGEAGVSAAVIITAGFKETGAAGKKLEDEILAIARQYGIRILGPNCLGYTRPGMGLNVTFAHVVPDGGRVAFLSQSGALGTSVLDWAAANHVGFSAFVSVGSMADVDFGDMIDYFGKDPNTSSIMLYVESITDARKFMSAARRFAKTKPIFVLKSGRTARSAMAAASHTGAMAGDDTLYSAVFRRAGMVRGDEISDLFDGIEALGRAHNPKGARLGILTNAGGPGVMASDLLITLGGELAELSEKTVTKLTEALPTFASSANPVDVLGDAGADRYAIAGREMMADPNVDGVLVILTPQANAKPTETAYELVEMARNSKKPLLASFMGEIMVGDALDILRRANVPVFDTPERAVRAYMNMYQYTRNLRNIYETPADILPEFEADRAAVKAIFKKVAAEDRSILTEFEAKKVLEAYDIPVVKTVIARTAEECAAAAEEIGFPVVVKILSNDITHKSDVGGVGLNIRSAAEAAEQFTKITERVKLAVPDAVLDGVTVQEMSRGGYEVIIGAKKDPTFGPALLFGLGGTGVEIYKDVAVEFPPLNQALAHTMIKGTKVSKLLEGYRGKEGVDMTALEQVLVKVSYLLVDFPEIIEMDMNPLQVRADGLCALDARFVIDPKVVKKIAHPGSHLIIPMYPHKYEWDTEIDGEKVVIRPIRPEDEPLWAHMIETLSADTSTMRFFDAFDGVTREMLVQYCHIDYDREIALVAVTQPKGKKKPQMMGVGRLVLDDSDSKQGEFSILVHDDFQRKGIGSRLTNALIEVASERRIEEIHGDVLEHNPAMSTFAEGLGFEVCTGREEGLKTIRMRL